MKRSTTILALLAATLAWPAHGAVIGFTGPYAPGTFATTFAGSLGPAGGSTFINMTTVRIEGGDDLSPDPVNQTPACTGATYGVAGPCEVRFVTTNIMNPFAFDWSYSTADLGGPGGDLFGMLVDGVRVQLSDPGGPILQSGHQSVSATSSFGWYVNCTDCIEGRATATITNFSAGVTAVPEPMTVALLGLGGVAAGAIRRRRRPGVTSA